MNLMKELQFMQICFGYLLLITKLKPAFIVVLQVETFPLK